MSCHDIGRGMNTVVYKTMGLYQSGKIEKQAAKEIIEKCRKGVNWCDGNEYEAIDCIEGRVCGYCMNIVNKNEKMYRLYDALYWDTIKKIEAKISDEKLITFSYCKECFKNLLSMQYDDDKCKEIIEKMDKEENFVLSKGYKDFTKEPSREYFIFFGRDD